MKKGFYDGLTISEATTIQNDLRSRQQIIHREAPITTIAGADISLNLHSPTIYAGIILLNYPDMRPLAYSLVKAETHFPYVPGFLAFREVPALVDVWQQMDVKPDVLVVDGHGIAHPRRMGIAAHFGALTGQTSMGCAKNPLCGRYDEPAPTRGSYNIIYDKGEAIGHALRSKEKTAPVYISPGQGLNLEDSLAIAKHSLGKYRIPEPTRRAHELVNRFRTGDLKEGYYKV